MVKQVLEVRAAREVKVVKEGRVDTDQADRDQADKVDKADKGGPVAVEGKGPAAAVLARAEMVAVGKNKCGPAGVK